MNISQDLSPKSPINIQSLIVRNPLTVTLGTSVGRAIALMAEVDSSYVIVVDENKLSQGMGIFTERDLVRVSAQRLDLQQLTMDSVMSHPMISIQEESVSTITDINVISAIFQKHQIRHLAVLSGDRLVGLLIQDNLIELLAQQVSQLALSEERSKLALKGANDAIWDWDLEHNTKFFSSRWKQMRGFSDHEIVNSPDECLKRIHPNDYQRFMKVLDDHVLGRTEFFEIEYRSQCKDGSYIWVLDRGQTVKNQAGRATRFIGFETDISDRKYSEEKLQKSEQRYRALMDNASDAICLANADGNLIEVNHKAEILLGYNREELSKLHVSQIHPLDSLQEVREHFQGIVQGITTSTLETFVLRKDGSQVPVEITGTRIDLENTFIAQGIFRDISDRKNHEHQLELANAELIRATRLKDEFLANMSHELRTPLNAILGMSEGLLEGILGAINERQSQAIAAIEKSGRHLLALINDILDLSKIEAGKLELEITKVDILQLCQSSLNFVKHQAFKRQIQLRANLSKEVGEMSLDERRIRQVLINLLSNAVKFTPIGGRVTLDVHYEPIEVNLAEHISLTRIPLQSKPNSVLESCPLEDRFYLCISVTDTGIGISPLDQLKLFKPFVQIDSSFNRKYEGTGLGLALVKQIVEMHGGDVNLRSQIGEGSCFTVRLPYVCMTPDFQISQLSEDDQSQIIDTSFEQSNPLSQSVVDTIPAMENTLPTILIAEDNEANTISVTSYLQAKGYYCVIAQNGQEAINLARIHHPQLILMDIQMPEMDGITATKQIRNEPILADIPIIALTALAMTGDREKCLEAGANDYLSKPYQLKYLAKVIEDLIAKNEKP